MLLILCTLWANLWFSDRKRFIQGVRSCELCIWFCHFFKKKIILPQVLCIGGANSTTERTSEIMSTDSISGVCFAPVIPERASLWTVGPWNGWTRVRSFFLLGLSFKWTILCGKEHYEASSRSPTLPVTRCCLLHWFVRERNREKTEDWCCEQGERSLDKRQEMEWRYDQLFTVNYCDSIITVQCCLYHAIFFQWGVWHSPAEHKKVIRQRTAEALRDPKVMSCKKLP